MKRVLLAVLILCCGLCMGQTYTTVTATLTDGQGQIWANASFTATIIPPFGNPSPLTNHGTPPITPLSGFTNGVGTFTIPMDDNTAITPSGSVWQFTICPNATVRVCSTSIQVVFGASMNLSASLSADLSQIVVGASPTLQRAYGDGEVNGGQGAIYWRVSDNTIRGFNGSTWVAVGGGGGGSSSWSALTNPTGNLTLSMAGNTTSFNMGTTSSTGSAFDITDGTSNTGTNYLMRIWTGTSSTAKTVEFCTQGTTICVQMAGGTFSAIGGAQNIATQVIGIGTGTGSVTLPSNGSGAAGVVNAVVITGNSNKLYVNENSSTLQKVLLGGQVTCGANLSLNSTDNNGVVTCIDNQFRGAGFAYDVTGANLNTNGTPGHFVIGSNTLVAGSATVSLASNAVYLSSGSYHCNATDLTAANAMRVNQTSGSSFTVTGTSTDGFHFICYGQ